jgi:amino acid transporter
MSHDKKLSKSLGILEVIGLSIALMAPSMAANINPQGPASIIGRAVPLAFLASFIGVLFVSYGFIRLTQRFNHSGSLYGLVGKTVGPRAGVVAGVSLLSAYIFFIGFCFNVTGRFIVATMQELGFYGEEIDPGAFAFGLVALAIAIYVAIQPVKKGTRALLYIEGGTVVLILITALVVLFKVASGSAPAGQTLNFDGFSLADGVDFNAAVLAVVFGFLSFAGFEAAITLGEEAHAPRKDIPKALLWSTILVGTYYVFVTWIETLGFGTDAAGVEAFVGSASLLGDLGTAFIGSWIGTIITAGAAISGFACLLAAILGAARVLFALGRDAGVETFSKVSAKSGVPTTAVYWTSGIALIAMLLWKFAYPDNSGSFDIFLATATIGTVLILVSYAFATLGSIKFLFFGKGHRHAPMHELVIPVVGLLVLIYVIYRNVWPLADPGTPARGYVYIVVSVLAAISVFVLAAPNFARKMGERLNADENLVEVNG